MPSRTFHHKSRHGCLNCKQRRKRCDQKRPICSRCARRRTTCIYDPSLYSVTASPGSPIRPLATEWATIEPSIQAILSLQMPHVDFSDLEMIYHFHTRQPTTLDTMPGVSGIRRLNLVERAPEYPYLLYGLIAASALHTKSGIGIEQPTRLDLEEKANNCYQLALSTYIIRLNNIDEQTCHSIFAFSVILAALTFGLLHPATPVYQHNHQTYIDSIVGIFELLLGAVAVAHQSRAWIPLSLAVEPLLMPIRASLSPQTNSVKSEAHELLDLMPSEIDAAYTLGSFQSSEKEAVDISVIYESAIPELRNLFFCLLKPEPNNILGVIGWPAFVGRPFVSLLKQRQPAALVVLAYYGVALQTLNHVWWLHGVGSRLIRSVAEVITTRYGEEWQRLLQWPLAKLINPELVASTGQTPAHSTVRPDRDDSSARDARPFEVGLVITQFKGITGPYRNTSSSHDR